MPNKLTELNNTLSTLSLLISDHEVLQMIKDDQDGLHSKISNATTLMIETEKELIGDRPSDR